MPADPTPEIDFDRIRAEIDEEVRLRRAGGDWPIGMDKELEELFGELSPTAKGRDEFALTLEQAEERTFISSEVPTASNIPGGQQAKKALAKAVGWHVRFVAQQTTEYARSVTRALQVLAQRIDILDEQVRALQEHAEGATTTAAEQLLRHRNPPDLTPLAPALLDRIDRTIRKRSLHAECGDGSLLARLRDAGVEGYGIDLDERAVEHAVTAQLDARVDDALTHLRVVPKAALGALVLSGCTERLPVRGKVELLELARSALTAGGTIAVISTTADAWGRGRTAVEADLAPGRPLAPETWQALLQERGFVDASRHDEGDVYAVIAVRRG
jgi:SAM-dependent methyltransferase